MGEGVCVESRGGFLEGGGPWGERGWRERRKCMHLDESRVDVLWLSARQREVSFVGHRKVGVC